MLRCKGKKIQDKRSLNFNSSGKSPFVRVWRFIQQLGTGAKVEFICFTLNSGLNHLLLPNDPIHNI